MEAATLHVVRIYSEHRSWVRSGRRAGQSHRGDNSECGDQGGEEFYYSDCEYLTGSGFPPRYLRIGPIKPNDGSNKSRPSSRPKFNADVVAGSQLGRLSSFELFITNGSFLLMRDTY
ncbi:hypothetical protein AG1IA_00844 [Rhizoctonia solani AG-1 IA]|uniref:Uncharacterized protein n=1 Tax=Thanatephorus cucumeris (strain AG1-IA) TaxID=983506 RepID=L8X7S4_THACA|nr:hypothetical protein AG1IA_00844 [Rhizoctonia solani AG-1 IA]